jgi:hypothetical protein
MPGVTSVQSTNTAQAALQLQQTQQSQQAQSQNPLTQTNAPTHHHAKGTEGVPVAPVASANPEVGSKINTVA